MPSAELREQLLVRFPNPCGEFTHRQTPSRLENGSARTASLLNGEACRKV
jgi:hypothetical protein